MLKTVLELPQSCPKTPGIADRCVPLEQTLSLLPALRERFGITRIADTTYLDRSGIPTTSAIVPQSPDLLSVYSGKGATRDGAICSGVMEAVERQCAASPNVSSFEMDVADVERFLDLDRLGLLERARNTRVQCVWGTDLLSQCALPVPLALVQCPWFGIKLFAVTSTNGLASGNTLTEAIYHALCELIERHVWSMYHARCRLVPRVYLGAQADDLGLAREIIFPTGNAAVDALASSIQAAGFALRALCLAEPPLPATMVATVFEPGSSLPMMHMGFGTSLAPWHALSRAMTEAAQSRVVDIQGAREDVVRANAPKSNMADHARRRTELPFGSWYFDAPCAPVALESLADLSSDDLAADLRTVLRLLRHGGMDQVIAVDLSPADLPVSVVRVIVPQLETMLIDGRIGPKIKALLNPFNFAPLERAGG